MSTATSSSQTLECLTCTSLPNWVNKPIRLKACRHVICALCFSELVAYQRVRREYNDDNPFSTKESNSERERNKITVPCPICAKEATYNLKFSVFESAGIVDFEHLSLVVGAFPTETFEEEEKFEANLDLSINLLTYLDGLQEKKTLSLKSEPRKIAVKEHSGDERIPTECNIEELQS